MFKITPKFNEQEIRKYFLEQKKRIEQAILMRLQRTGEQFVKEARENGAYKDRTGNLRNSIGYVILKDGQQLVDNFGKVVKITAGKDEGVKKAKSLVKQIVEKYPKGFVLICVAGMEYAAAVESKGFDVITSSAFVAKESLDKGLKDLQKKIAA